MRGLIVAETPISEIPSFIGSWKQLEILGASSTKISELPELIGNCKNLSALYLDNTNI